MGGAVYHTDVQGGGDMPSTIPKCRAEGVAVYNTEVQKIARCRAEGFTMPSGQGRGHVPDHPGPDRRGFRVKV